MLTVREVRRALLVFGPTNARIWSILRTTFQEDQHSIFSCNGTFSKLKNCLNFQTSWKQLGKVDI